VRRKPRDYQEAFGGEEMSLILNRHNVGKKIVLRNGITGRFTGFDFDSSAMIQLDAPLQMSDRPIGTYFKYWLDGTILGKINGKDDHSTIVKVGDQECNIEVAK